MSLTPWFKRAQAPTRPGVYEVQFGKHTSGRPFKNQLGRWFAYWDGAEFRSATGCVHRANIWRSCEVTGLHVVLWRGLAHDPNRTNQP